MGYRAKLPCPKCKEYFVNLDSHMKHACYKGKSKPHRQKKIKFVRDKMKNLIKNMVLNSSEVYKWVTGKYSFEKILNKLDKKGFMIKHNVEIVHKKQIEAQHIANDGNESVHYYNEPDLNPEFPMDSDQDSEQDQIQDFEADDEVPNLNIDSNEPDIRKRLKKAGLTKMIDKQDPVIKSFYEHFVEEGKQDKASIKNDTVDIRRLFYFLGKYEIENPLDVDLKWLLNHPNRINHWFHAFSKAKYKPASLSNSMKAVEKFLTFLESYPDPPSNIPDFYDCIRRCRSAVIFSKKGIHRSIASEIRSNLYERATSDAPIDIGFCKILSGRRCTKLKNDIKNKISSGEPLTSDEQAFIMRYCICVIVIKYYQRPSVAHGLSLKEYTNKHLERAIFVREHKTKGSRPAFFPFDEDDRFWFDTYMNSVRIHYAANANPADAESFFLNNKSKPICNASKEVTKFQKKDLKMTKTYSSTEIRSAVESRAARDLTLTNEERSLIHKYMQHSAATASKYYEKIPKEAVYTVGKLTRKLFTLPEPLETEEVNDDDDAQVDASDQLEFGVDGADGSPLQDKTATPPPSDNQLLNLVQSQKWPLIEQGMLTDPLERGVFAKTFIKKDTIICDYHGTLWKRRKFQKFLSSKSEEEQSYIVRYQVDFEYDSHHFSIDAHIDDGSFGRLVNHCPYPKHKNVSLFLYIINEEKIVFVKTKRDVQVGEQLVWKRTI